MLIKLMKTSYSYSNMRVAIFTVFLLSSARAYEVNVLVGEEQVPYRVDSNLLKTHSDFYRDVLEEGDVFEMNHPRLIPSAYSHIMSFFNGGLNTLPWKTVCNFDVN